MAPDGTMAIPTPARTKLIIVANWVTVAAWRSVCPAVEAAPSIMRRVRESSGKETNGEFTRSARSHGCVLRRFGKRMSARQDHVEDFAAHAFCIDEIGHVIYISDAKVGGTTAYVLEHRAVHTFTQYDFNSRSRGSIFGDDCRKQAIRDRHDAGDYDLAALLFANLPHAADADPQVVQHPLCNGHKFLARRSNSNASCAAIEQADAENVFNALDGSKSARAETSLGTRPRR